MTTVYTFTESNGRAENQDNFLVSEFQLAGSVEVGYLALVADGVGGLSRGREASALVSSLFQAATDFSLYSIEALFVEAHKGIQGLGSSGSTLSLIRIYAGEYNIAHIGDTRIYRIPAGSDKGTQLTKDHSALQVFKDKGRVLTPEEYAKYQGKLTRGLGHGATIEPEYYHGFYKPGDSFLLCSDGFWHGFEFSNATLPSLDNYGLLSIADLAVSKGETDNLTAVLIADL